MKEEAPPTKVRNPLKVAYINKRVETLWEIEELVGRKNKCLPTSPLRKKDNQSEVGRRLLWKNDDRTHDEWKQAIAHTITLQKRFLRHGTLEDYNKGLIEWHMEVGAVEEDNSLE